MDRLFVAYGNAIFGTHELLTWGQRTNRTLRADPSDPDDRDALARAVAAIDAQRFEAYMLVLITEGMLVPAGGRP